MQVQYIVLSRLPTGNYSFHPFESFQEAQSFAKEEAKRLLADGPVVIFKPDRSYSATIEVKEGETIL